MTPGIIIQARLGSKRFPNKVLKVNKWGKKLINIVYDECKKTNLSVTIAIPEEDQKLFEYLNPKHDVLRGPNNDVIARYYGVAKFLDIDPIIRVCADAKNIHAELILQQLENYKKYKHICHGNYCEVFSFKQLEDYYLHDKRPITREHVTMGMIQDMSVDYEIDLK